MPQLLPKEAFIKNAEIYKVLANPKRLEILNLLGLREFAFEELRSVLKLPKANISQHLALLRHAKLVTVRRTGQKAHYQIVDRRIVDPCRILHELRQHHKLAHV